MSEPKPTIEPVSDDIKRALERRDKTDQKENIRQEAEKRAELAKLNEGEVTENYKAIFNVPMGKSILEDLKDYCCYTKSVYNPDPVITNINIGKNEVLLYILEKIKPKTEET
jgi:hypothetical protein